MKTKAFKVENREGIEMFVSNFRYLSREVVAGVHIGDGDNVLIATFTPHQLADLIKALHTIMLGFSQVSPDDEPTDEPDDAPRVVVIESETDQVTIGISKTSTSGKKLDDSMFLNITDIDERDHPVFFTTKQAIKFAQTILALAFKIQEGNEKRNHHD